MKSNEINSRVENRNWNRGLFLKLIATGQCKTRSDLTFATGLSKMGVSKIVNELISNDLLSEIDLEDELEFGRRPKGLIISKNSPLIMGVMIERNACMAIVTDIQLKVLYHNQINLDEPMNNIIFEGKIYQLIDDVIAKYPDIIAIGLASIGPVDTQRGVILAPFYFHDLKNIHIVELIQERYHLPVYFDHDNQSAVLAESLFGCAKNLYDVIYIGISLGVGSGVILNGSQYHNHRYLPPEFGHISINENGKLCTCGNKGCIEIDLRTPKVLGDLSHIIGQEIKLQDIDTYQDLPKVKDYFEMMLSKFAVAIISFINLTNCQLIILGKDSMYWPEYCRDILERKINEKRFVKWDTPVQVKLSAFGQDTPLMGAACNVISTVFAGGLLF